jgi:DNA mismatch repair protein MutS2
MQLIPKHILSALEYDKILLILKSNSLGPFAKEHFDNPVFYTEEATVNNKLDEVAEYKKVQLSNAPLQLSDYESILEDTLHLETAGFVLSIEALKRIDRVIKNLEEIKGYFKGERKKLFSNLHSLIDKVAIPDELKLGLEKILDKDGEIKPDASPALLKITRSITRKSHEINQSFNKVSQVYRQKGWLSETLESYRNGRRVLSAPAEYKRKIRGIIHDESASGKTVYIEPEELIGLNNDYFDLESDYRREVYQILKELSNQMRPFTSEINNIYKLTGYFDIIQAKARLAISMNGSRVQVKKSAHIGFKKAFHPLLLLKNDNLGLKTVPFDMELHKSNKIIVLSGPNAGGKSVTLKAVGLLQLMVQSGLLIPADENTRIGTFKRIFADIGDQQSLEDDLSTYSSRLSNMKAFLEHADHDTLFLIDEFGSGTDPQIGGAIAEAILRALNHSNAYGVVTTHYSNLKFYAFKTRGIINASMLFDQKRFEPTYELNLGKPGSSFAFEIAQKTGLSKDILKYARFKTGKNVKKIEDLVIDLQSEKQELEHKLTNLAEKEKELDKLIRNYDRLHRDLDVKRKKLKLEKKELSIIDLNRYNRELEQIIKEIKENQKLDKALELSKEIKEKRQETIQMAEELQEQVMESTKHDWKDLKVGDFVKLKSGGQAGQIKAILNKKAQLEIGLMKMTVKLSELIPTQEPLKKMAGVNIQTELSAYQTKFDPKIDIRGYSKTDAADTLQEFFDNAILANASFLQIMHGKGNGVLRQLVREMLKEYKDVDTVTHPAEENGGNGVTLVTLR